MSRITGIGIHLSVFSFIIPPPLRFIQRRNEYCEPQKAQNDIQSFFLRPSSPACLRGRVGYNRERYTPY